MRKFILTFCATLLSIGAVTAAVKPEAGKYYLIESMRPLCHGHFLSDTELGGSNSLVRTDDITANAVWYVAPGTDSDAITVQNYVTKGYLFEQPSGTYRNVTSEDALDLFVFENTYYDTDNVYGLTLRNSADNNAFLNALGGGSAGTTNYVNYDDGSGWLFYPLDTDNQTVEDAIASTYFRGGAINYHVTSQLDKTVEVYPGNYSGTVTIPSTVANLGITYTVTAVRDFTFKQCTSLTEIQLASTIISIGEGAFQYCTSLTDVDLSATIIGDKAFSGCTSLTDVEVSATIIGDKAFSGCTSLTDVELSATTIGDKAFSGCSSLSSISLLNSTPPTLGEGAFDGTDLKVVYVPKEAIGAYQSADVWKEYYIADISTKSGTFVTKFTSNGLNYHILSRKDKSVEILRSDITGETIIPATVTYDNVEYSVTTIGAWAFYKCTSLTDIVIPNSVTTIVDHAFDQCTSLSSIVLPNSVTTVGQSAFAWCYSLSDVKLSTSLTNIDTYTFARCILLTDIELPESITSLSNYVFEDCSALASVTSLNTVPPTLGSNVFAGCDLLGIFVPKDAIEAYKSADGWSNFVIADVATKEGEVISKFTVDGINYHVTSLTDNTTVYVTSGDYSGDIVIPNSVTYSGRNYVVTAIGDQAFVDCYDIRSVQLPNSVTSIGSSAFEGCSSLTGIEIPNSVTSIGNYAFAYCSSLTDIEIPNSWTSIGEGIFYGCNSLRTIEIPASVNSIGTYAFANCLSLASVTSLNPTPPTLENEAFGNCDIMVVYVPSNAIEVYKKSDGWSSYYIADVENKSGEIISKFTIDGITYHVTSFNATTVYVSHVDYEIEDDVVIPETVTYSDINFTVAAIDGYIWFSSKAIEIPASVTSIGGALSGGLVTVTCLNPIPPLLEVDTFSDGDILAVYVPTDAVEAYRAADGWKEYNIMDVNNKIVDLVSSFEVDNISYRVTSIVNNSVRIAGFRLTEDTAVAVPETVTYSGVTYAVTSLGDGVFSYKASLTSVTLPNSITEIPARAFYRCTSLTSVKLPDSLLSIGELAFAVCTSLTKVEIPETVTFIDEQAFNYCTSLVSIKLSDTLNSIGYNLFRDCTSLSSVELPNSLTTIEDEAFYRCRSLTELKFPDSLTTIGESAFSGCDSLNNIELPASVTSIGNYAFSDYSMLMNATVTSLSLTPPTVGDYVFGRDATVVIYVPIDAVEDYKAADGWKDYTIVGFGESSVNELHTAAEECAVVCYTLQGIHVKTVRTMSDLKSLTTGIYIVNGKKILVK